MIETYKRHSPSALNLFAASPSMFVLEKVLGRRQPVGVPAYRGIAVEDGVTCGLLDPAASLQACTDVAFRKYDTITALSGDKRRDEYRAPIPAMVEQALIELRPYGIPTKCQGFVERRPEGLKLPVGGYFDYEWEQHGIVADLKTSEKLPSSIKPPHARQVSFYCDSDNFDARLTYVTPKKKATYRVENIRDHRNALYEIARRIENFLALSSDPAFFTSITAPDVESFYWSGPPARQLAFKHWGV